MSDLLAKCDWHGDELRVELPQWPEVVTVWVDGKAMPFAPVTDKDMLGAIKCLQGLAEATGEENTNLRELVRDMARAWWACDNERCPHGSSCDAAVSEGKLTDCEMERRMRELGVEL